MDWSDAIAAEDLVNQRAKRIMVGDEPVLVLRVGDEILAIGNQCTHQGAPLDKGVVKIGGSVRTVTCPAHGSTFRLDDGKVMRPPATTPVAAYDVKVENGRIFLRPREQGR